MKNLKRKVAITGILLSVAVLSFVVAGYGKKAAVKNPVKTTESSAKPAEETKISKAEEENIQLKYVQDRKADGKTTKEFFETYFKKGEWSVKLNDSGDYDAEVSFNGYSVERDAVMQGTFYLSKGKVINSEWKNLDENKVLDRENELYLVNLMMGGGEVTAEQYNAICHDPESKDVAEGIRKYNDAYAPKETTVIADAYEEPKVQARVEPDPPAPEPAYVVTEAQKALIKEIEDAAKSCGNPILVSVNEKGTFKHGTEEDIRRQFLGTQSKIEDRIKRPYIERMTDYMYAMFKPYSPRMANGDNALYVSVLTYDPAKENRPFANHLYYFKMNMDGKIYVVGGKNLSTGELLTTEYIYNEMATIYYQS